MSGVTGKPQYPRQHNRESSQPACDAENIALGGADQTPGIALDGGDTKATAWRGLYVGTGGTVKVDTFSGTGLLFKNVPAGTFMPIWVKKVYATANGTTAADIIGLY